MASVLRNPAEEAHEVTLHVKIEKTVTLQVNSSETIKNIKAFVKDRELAAPINQQELLISGNQLKDEYKLSDYIGVGNSSVSVVCRDSTVKINVKRMSADGGVITTSLQVKMNDTVKLVKFLIDSREGTRSDEYKLIFDGVHLHDYMTVVGSGLKNDSVLYMVIVPKDTMALRIAMPCGRIEIITVKPLNTIFDLKVILQRNIDMAIDQWHLAYSDEALEDHKTIASCGFKDDSLLQVRLPSVQILVRIHSGEHITVFIKLTDVVRSLKEKIFHKTGCPVKYQTLIFEGKVLADWKSMISYGIQKSSTVHLSFNHANLMQNDKN